MADIDNALRLWSSTASNNKPIGSTSIGSGLDDNLRQIQSVVRQYLASPGTTIASAATVDLSLADGRQIPISGTNTVTGLGTEVSGVEYLLTTVGTLQFKNSSALVLPKGADYSSSPGDYLLAVSKGAGNWVVPWTSRRWDIVSVKDFGTTGTSDDATVFQLALNSGALGVLIPPGSYTCGPLTTSQAGQKIFAHGATITLKAASVSSLFRANAAGVEIFGGTWSANNIAQSAIVLAADYCTIQEATLQLCGGAGIVGLSNANYLTIAKNVIKDAVTYGIYVECLTADAYGNKIIDNQIDTSATAGAAGIYLTGTNLETFFQRQWQVRGNRCNGSVSTPTAPGLTVRAVDGICTENHVIGYTLGVTADITSRSVISNNRVEGVVGATGYNIEVNGHHNVITGNYTKGGKYGLVISSSTDDLSHNTISGNTFENPTVNAIYIIPSGGKTARYTVISGNNIDMSDVSAGTRAIYLTGDCIHAHITGNNVLGRGSGTANTRAVYLDTPPAAAFISIIGNKISGFERACGVFSSGALTVTDLTSNGNDVSSDVSQSTAFWNFETSAVVGTRVTHINSKNVNGSYQDVHDMLLNVFTLRSTAANNPETVLTAGIGSLFISLNSGQVPYIKSTGANTNTGWVAL